MRAHLHVQAVTVHPAHDQADFLVVRILVTCDVCGEHEIVIAGHHLKPLLELLHSVVTDVDPALVEASEEATVFRSILHIADPRNN